MALPAGSRVGSYEILSLVGAGGMGQVYRSRDIRLQRFAAIKIIKPDAADDELVRRFEAEALSASALNHPNILTVYEFGTHDGLHFLATEFIEGETLRDRLRRGPVAVRTAVDIALQTASALEAAHDAGLIHRDVKPENIMIRPDGYVKVLDFGLAKLAPDTTAAAESLTISLRTMPGVILGTVGYMSPEQVRGTAVDQRADIWALGTVLHETISGRSPFAGDTVGDVIASVLERQPPPLSATSAGVPPELDWIVRKSLAKSVEDRYQTATDLVVDLRRLKTQLERKPDDVVPAVPTAQPPQVPPKARTSALPLALAGILAIAGAGWVASQWRVDAPAPAGPAAVTRTLQYWLTVQAMRDGKPDGPPFEASGEEIFDAGDRFTFNFIAPDAGYMYLLNDGPGGAGARVMHHLHPLADAPSAHVPGGQPVPSGTNALDSNPGTEEFWVVWSTVPVPELEKSRAYANPEDLALVKDEALAAAIRRMLEANSTREPPTKDRATQRQVIRAQGDLIAHRIDIRHK